MAKSKQGLRARVTRTAGRRRKKPTNPVERAFDDLKQLVSDTGDRVLSRAGQGKERQAAVKKVGATRIRKGQQRQAQAKKAARRRGAKTT